MKILRLPHVNICPRCVLKFEYPGRLGRFDSGIPNVVLLLSALAGWDSEYLRCVYSRALHDLSFITEKLHVGSQVRHSFSLL